MVHIKQAPTLRLIKAAEVIHVEVQPEESNGRIHFMTAKRRSLAGEASLLAREQRDPLLRRQSR